MRWNFQLYVLLAFVAASGPMPSAADENVGKMIFEYADTAFSQCIPGIETPFRAAFTDVSVTLIPVEDLFGSTEKCYRKERRGVEVKQVVADCGEGIKEVRIEVPALFAGTFDACQRGPEIRLKTSALTVSMVENDVKLETTTLSTARRYSEVHDFNSFIEAILLRQSWTSTEKGRQYQFERRAKPVREAITDVPIQSEEMLPTNDVYGIKVHGEIAAKFGSIDEFLEGDSQ